MSDHLDRAAAIVGGCCAHCDDLVDERLALLDEAGMLASPERVIALPLPSDGCACTPHEQSAGGGYTEYLLEYAPACPEHSEHLWDPTQGVWVLRSEHDAEVAAKALREAAEDAKAIKAHAGGGNLVKDVHALTADALRARADRIEEKWRLGMTAFGPVIFKDDTARSERSKP